MVRGTGQKVRGLKYGAYRPTLTIIDDGEGDGNAQTPMAREKFRRWIDTSVVPGSDDGKIVFIGTIVDEEAYLNTVAGSKAFNKDALLHQYQDMTDNLIELADDLGWEYDRMSSSGQETLDKMYTVLGMQTINEIQKEISNERNKQK